MKSTISATQAARSFSDLVNRVRYRGEEFIVERGGQAVCRIVPAGPPAFTALELAQLLRSLPRPDDAYFTAVEEAARRQPALPKSPWRR